jgi:predicted nucleic acid-binding protein
LAFYYLETSALVKLYVREPGTERLLALTDPAVYNRFAILALAKVELRSAVRRRQRSGEISTTVASLLLDLFQRHVEARFLTQNVTDSALDFGSMLIDRYGLRAYNAIQLGGYLALRTTSGDDAPIFVCSDHDLLSAAAQEGIPIFDPCL